MLLLVLYSKDDYARKTMGPIIRFHPHEINFSSAILDAATNQVIDMWRPLPKSAPQGD
jgi:hypothetical protein